MWAWILVGLGVFGLLDSLYFLGVTLGWMRPDSRWVPSFCRMDEASCARIVDTPQARALGVPNSLLGALWYSTVIAAGILAGLGILTTAALAVLALLAVDAVTLSVFLAYQLRFKLRVACPLCYAAHVANVLVLAAIILLLWANA